MRILVNAFNMASGGGLVHAQAILTGLTMLDSGHEYLAIVPALPEYEQLAGTKYLRLQVHPVRWAFPLRHVQYYAREIPRAALAFKADAMLSLTSLAIPRLNIPQFVLANQALLAVPASYYRPHSSWWFRTKVALQRLTFRVGLGKIAALLVHSRFMEYHFRTTWGFRGAIVHVPPFKAMQARIFDPRQSFRDQLPQDGRFTVLYPAAYTHYKNFGPLLEAFAILRSRGARVRLVTTVPHRRDTRGFFETVSELCLDDTIVNVGTVPLASMPALYERVDATVQVSLLESYGLTYIESFQHERPQVVADLPFGREMCGDACLFVSPNSATEIADGIAKLAGDPALQADLVRRGREHLATVVVSVEEYARRLVDAVVQGTLEIAARADR